MHNKDPEDLLAVIEAFVQMSGTDAAALDAFEKNIYDGDNLRQYRVKVHAMKTSAAMIGALTVSSVAKLLEYAARDEKTDVIKTMHPVFMEQWKSLNEQLQTICSVEEDEQELKELDKELLEQELILLTQAMAEYDVDVADGIIEKLSHYRYPDDKKAVFDELTQAVQGLDAEAVVEAVSKLLL